MNIQKGWTKFKSIRLHSSEFILGLILLTIFLFIFVTDGINVIQHQAIGYDEGYNATVAANVMRHGVYRTSYPAKITFYNLITTGQSVLLPTALLYKLFGINTVTSTIVSLIYGTLDIILFWWLLNKCLSNRKGKYLLSSILVYIFLMTDQLFLNVSLHLLGESASLCFLLAAFICLAYYYETKNKNHMIISGCMVAFSFLTKTSMIFFVVSISGMIFIEMLITRRIKIIDGIYFFVGFLFGIIFMDLYKLIQLGGLNQYMTWWAKEWINMINQSSGIDAAYNISEKIDYLTSIFEYNKYFCLFILIIPSIFYLFHIFTCLLRSKKCISDKAVTATIAGVSGSSLIIYFILLGRSGLVYSRRHTVNELMVKFFVAYAIEILLFILVDMIKKRREEKISLVRSTLASLGLISLFPSIQLQNIKTSTIAYLNKTTEDSYELQLMNAFIEQINNLGDDAVLYCGGWWQEPLITLYLDKDMRSIYNVQRLDHENGYFIVGRRFDRAEVAYFENIWRTTFTEVDSIEVDYNRLYPYEAYELFSIYKIN